MVRDAEYLRLPATYWLEQFDWRMIEAKLDAMLQFIADTERGLIPFRPHARRAGKRGRESGVLDGDPSISRHALPRDRLAISEYAASWAAVGQSSRPNDAVGTLLDRARGVRPSHLGSHPAGPHRIERESLFPNRSGALGRSRAPLCCAPSGGRREHSETSALISAPPAEDPGHPDPAPCVGARAHRQSAGTPAALKSSIWR
jgi:hypothetical protein